MKNKNKTHLSSHHLANLCFPLILCSFMEKVRFQKIKSPFSGLTFIWATITGVFIKEGFVVLKIRLKCSERGRVVGFADKEQRLISAKWIWSKESNFFLSHPCKATIKILPPFVSLHFSLGWRSPKLDECLQTPPLSPFQVPFCKFHTKC